MKDLMGVMKKMGEMQARMQKMQEDLGALEIDGESRSLAAPEKRRRVRKATARDD